MNLSVTTFICFLMKKIRGRVVTLSFFLTLLFVGINFTMEYASDTYSTFLEADTWKWMLYENGRIVNAVIYYVLEQLSIPFGYLYKLSYLTAFFFILLAVSFFASLINTIIHKETLAVLLSFLCIVNFYSIEYFLFIEKGLFFAGIFLCILALFLTVTFFQTKNYRLLLFSFFSLLVAVFMYQALLGLYAVLCLPFLIYYSKNGKDFLIKNGIIALLYGIPMAVSFVITGFLFQSSRISASEGIHLSLNEVVIRLKEILTKRWFHIPEGLFLLFFFLMIILFCFTFWGREHKKIGKELFFLSYLLCAVFIISFFPQLLGVTTSYSPRVLYPFASVFGVFFLYFVLCQKGCYQNKLCFLYQGVLLFLLCIQYCNFQSVFIERYRSNQADRYYVSILSHQIQEYEKANNTVISTICFYHDQNITWWEEGYEESNLHPRAQSLGWSNLNAINLYSGKSYVKGEPEAEYEEHFKKFDWNTYCEEQLIFEGDILHLCIY